MKLLNLGCGYPRLLPPFINMDTLHSFLHPGTIERGQLDEEGNYINHDSLSGPMPLEDESMDGILASHFFEHFDCQEAERIMRDCYRVLRPGAALVVSVPDASYFRKVYKDDNRENCVMLFGEPLPPESPDQTFFDHALWFVEHYAILSEDSLWAYFTRCGFWGQGRGPWQDIVEEDASEAIESALASNRTKFSLVMAGVKP